MARRIALVSSDSTIDGVIVVPDGDEGDEFLKTAALFRKDERGENVEYAASIDVTDAAETDRPDPGWTVDLTGKEASSARKPLRHGDVSERIRRPREKDEDGKGRREGMDGKG